MQLVDDGEQLPVAHRLRDLFAAVPDLVLGREPLPDLHVFVRELLLGLVELAQRSADLVHPSILSIRTAATLKIGCFDTGSQRVIVSSFAARGRPSGPFPPSSQ